MPSCCFLIVDRATLLDVEDFSVVSSDSSYKAFRAIDYVICIIHVYVRAWIPSLSPSWASALG
jgi:hypothetical protein